MANHRGFSLIELVVVIVLLGIIGAVAFSRLTSPNAFNEAAAQDALLTTIRQAQQVALGRSDASFEIASVGDVWELVAKSGVTTVTAIRVPVSGVKLETGSSVWTTDTCAAGGSFDIPVSSFVINFDNQGNIKSFNNATVGLQSMSPTFNGVRICVNDKVAASVCVSPAGYAHTGNCDE